MADRRECLYCGNMIGGGIGHSSSCSKTNTDACSQSELGGVVVACTIIDHDAETPDGEPECYANRVRLTATELARMDNQDFRYMYTERLAEQTIAAYRSDS